MYVYVLWEGATRKKRVRKDKLTIVSVPASPAVIPDADIGAETDAAEDDGCDTSDDESPNLLRPSPSSARFWSDTTAFTTATAAQASLRKKRRAAAAAAAAEGTPSTRKVTRAALSAEARGVGKAPAVDENKRTSKSVRLEAEAMRFDTAASEVRGGGAGDVAHDSFPEAGDDEERFMTTVAATGGVALRRGGGRVYIPPAAGRTTTSRAKRSFQAAFAALDPSSPCIENGTDDRDGAVQAEDEPCDTGDGSEAPAAASNTPFTSPLPTLGLGFAAAVLDGSIHGTSPFSSPFTTGRKGKYGRRGSRLTADNLKKLEEEVCS